MNMSIIHARPVQLVNLHETSHFKTMQVRQKITLLSQVFYVRRELVVEGWVVFLISAYRMQRLRS